MTILDSEDDCSVHLERTGKEVFSFDLELCRSFELLYSVMSVLWNTKIEAVGFKWNVVVYDMYWKVCQRLHVH